MTVQLKTIGGSLMAIIPAEIVRKAGLKPGQAVSVAYADGKIIIEPRPTWASFLELEFPPEADTFLLDRPQPQRRAVFGDHCE
jgi:antitoxin component of MazEF toxin-antitoxin module